MAKPKKKKDKGSTVDTSYDDYSVPIYEEEG